MSPYDSIKAKYESTKPEKSWLDQLEWYAREGFVFSTPEFFICGCEHKIEDKDCWYVFAAAGDIGKMWDVLPYQLGWIAFERIQGGKRDLRLYPIDDLRRLSRRQPITHDSIIADPALA
jgi:hypothetical protein